MFCVKSFLSGQGVKLSWRGLMATVGMALSNTPKKS